jgi:hypothetical protein
MMTRSEPECSATIPPPLRRRYVITTGWPLSAVALGGVAFAPIAATLEPLSNPRFDPSWPFGILVTLRIPSRLIQLRWSGERAPDEDIQWLLFLRPF